MQEAVYDRRKKDPRHYEKYNARIEGVKRRKQLARRCVEFIDWPHAAKKHHGIDQSIYLRKTFEPMITQDANSERAEYNAEGNARVKR